MLHRHSNEAESNQAEKRKETERKQKENRKKKGKKKRTNLEINPFLKQHLCDHRSKGKMHIRHSNESQRKQKKARMGTERKQKENRKETER